MAKNSNNQEETKTTEKVQATPTAQQPKEKVVIDWGEVQEEMESLESSGGKVWKQQDLKSGESEIIRLLLPSSGKFFGKYIGFWINSRFFLSRKSIGQSCEMFAEYQQALSSSDPDVKQRLANNKIFSFVEKEHFVGLFLNIKYDDDDEISSVKVKGGEARFVEVNKRQAQMILNYASMRENMAGTAKQSILHREKGKNISISRQGEGKQTDYTVTLLDRLDLTDAEFDKYYDNVPEIAAYLESKLKDEAYCAAVLRNYLYDEDIPDDFLDMYEADYEDVEEKPKSKSKFGKSKTSGSKFSKKSIADDLDDE